MSGETSAMAFTASKPLAHSAAISISGCPCSISRRKARASSSSSTITVCIVRFVTLSGNVPPPRTALRILQIIGFRQVSVMRQLGINKIIRPPAWGRRSERRFVSYKAETPFDNIEGSHEYVAMLADAVSEARRDVEAEIAAAEHDRADRRKEALLLASYNLAKLNLHIRTSRRILNDLRMLRRLLLAERGLPVGDDSEVPAGHGD